MNDPSSWPEWVVRPKHLATWPKWTILKRTGIVREDTTVFEVRGCWLGDVWIFTYVIGTDGDEAVRSGLLIQTASRWHYVESEEFLYDEGGKPRAITRARRLAGFYRRQAEVLVTEWML